MVRRSAEFFFIHSSSLYVSLSLLFVTTRIVVSCTHFHWPYQSKLTTQCTNCHYIRIIASLSAHSHEFKWFYSVAIRIAVILWIKYLSLYMWYVYFGLLLPPKYNRRRKKNWNIIVIFISHLTKGILHFDVFELYTFYSSHIRLWHLIECTGHFVNRIPGKKRIDCDGFDTFTVQKHLYFPKIKMIFFWNVRFNPE